MNASDRSVTQQDRVANPQKEAAVVHVTGTTALHRAYRTPAYEKLSTGARALYTFICLKSGKYGCVFFRMDKIAKATGLGRRILCLKRAELEAAGWITTTYVSRGAALPSGKIASRETAVFCAQIPLSQEPINDPAMLINDPPIMEEGGLTPFCDLLDLEEDPDVGLLPKTERAHAPIATEALEPPAQRILHQWQKRLAPSLFIDPESGRSWLRMIMARLVDGFTELQCFAAIEAHYHSPHNRTWQRRTAQHVFGDAERLTRMAELGVSHPPTPMAVKKVTSIVAPKLVMQISDNPTVEEIDALFDRMNAADQPSPTEPTHG